MKLSVQKKTGTYAETLEAIGQASLLSELGFGNITIADTGMEFDLFTSTELELAQWPERIAPGFPYIWESSKEPTKPDLQWVVDYEAERAKRDAARKVRQKSKTKMEAQELEAAAEPVPEFATSALLASMRKGWNSDRDLAKWIESNPVVANEWARFALGIVETVPPDLPTISNTQILNPIAGKGVNAPKTESRSAGSIPGQLVDPFAEWMKIRGLWESMLLYRSGDDFKFLVIEPTNVSFAGITAIKASLAALGLYGGTRLDINATLQCLKILITHSDVVQSATNLIALRRRRPRQVVAGLRLAFFKSLGTAAALMNDSFLPLPDWFAVDNTEDADAYLRIIDEVVEKGGCLNSLDEGHSDDGKILQAFREWLLTGVLTDLLEFHHQFAPHLMRRFASNEWARPFGTENLSSLLTRAFKENQVTEIIEDPGFQSVARAVRNATIYALTIPNMKREVRFGLAQKWKQKMKGGDDEFTAELAEFVQEYNWETAHKLKGVGHMVTTGELDSLMSLVAKKHAELVGSLLLAYGFARAPRVEPGQPDSEVAAA